MMKKLSRNPLPYDLPATYQISVQGRIDQTWSDRLEGMTISLSGQESGLHVTNMQGELSNQSALTGVQHDYELYLLVLPVNR